MGYAQAASRIYQYVPDNVVQLSNAGFARKFAYGNDWLQMRIGFLARITSPSNQGFNSCLCYFGIGSSYGSCPPSYSVGNFVGISLIGTPSLLTAKTLTFSLSWPNPVYTNSSSAPQVFTQTGNSVTTATQESMQPSWSSSVGGNNRRFPYILDLVRPAGGTGNYTVRLYCPSNNSSFYGIDHRPDHLFQCLDSVAAPPTSNGIALTASTLRTVAWSEATGPLDTFWLYWGKSYPLEVSAVGAMVIDSET